MSVKGQTYQTLTPEGKAEFDLGTAVLAAVMPAGHRATCPEIAAFTGMSPQGVWELERRALMKLRKKFRYSPGLMEMARNMGMDGTI